MTQDPHSLNNMRPFFCGIGGIGMRPIALMLAEKGGSVSGSDRLFDQNPNTEEVKALKKKGIKLFPQDGSGLNENITHIIASTAIEDTVPDIKRARELNIEQWHRAKLWASVFHNFDKSIGIAGTSGKTTVTGMVATILKELGLNPNALIGGKISHFNKDMFVGDSPFMVAEMDEHDSSIDLFKPFIGLIHNITLDHKSINELKTLFSSFAERSHYVCINYDDQNAQKLWSHYKSKTICYGMHSKNVDLYADNIKEYNWKSEFDITIKKRNASYRCELSVPGLHNISNALASLSICESLNLDIKKCIFALKSFQGISRRLQKIGVKRNVTVIDDYAHNPDKIAASLQTLKNKGKKVFLCYQPHGFGPLKQNGQEMMHEISKILDKNDTVILSPVYNPGGTVDPVYNSSDALKWLKQEGVQAKLIKDRVEIIEFLKSNANSGDIISVTGARDPSLTDFAQNILSSL